MREVLEYFSAAGLRALAVSYNQATIVHGARGMKRHELLAALEKRVERDPGFKRALRTDMHKIQKRKSEYILKKHRGKRVRFAKGASDDDEHHQAKGKMLLELL